MKDQQILDKINDLVTTLKSREVVEYFNQWQVEKLELLRIIVESKVGYDVYAADQERLEILKSIDDPSVYSVYKYSELIMFVSNNTDMTILQSSQIVTSFYLFHKSLYRTASFLDKLVKLNQQNVNKMIQDAVIPKELVAPAPVAAPIQEPAPVAAAAKVYHLPEADKNVHMDDDAAFGNFLKSLASFAN
jgi:hypothetical protein